MKKTKLTMAVALLVTASALFFTGCPKDPDVPYSGPVIPSPNPDPQPNPDPDPNPNPDPNPVTEEITLDLSAYTYRKNFVSTKETLTTTFDAWSSGCAYTPNDDGSLTLTSNPMWGGTNGVVVAVTGINAGIIAQYDYIVLTGDFSNFTLDESDAANAGVNIKVPEVQKRFDTKNINKDGTYTFYVPVSEFGDAPKAAVQIGIIIGGSGSVKLTEVYLAAKENPVKPVTAITLDPASRNLASDAIVTFSVKDSNLSDVTAATTFAIDGEDATGSKIEGNIFTAGKTSGTVKVKATYTCDDGTFTATAEFTVTAIKEEITLDLTQYATRKTIVTTTEAWESGIDLWGSGADYSKNEDGSLTLKASAGMWGGTPGAVIAFTGIPAGDIAKYEYIVFTVDFSAFMLDESEAANAGVNVKVPEVQKRFATKNTNSDGTYTYYVPVSEFADAPNAAEQFALIIGGTGNIKLTEVYFASK